MTAKIIDRQLAAVKNIILEGEGINSIDFHSKRRYSDLVLARYMFMVLIVRCFNNRATYKDIADYVGYSGVSKHSLVIHAMRCISDWELTDKMVRGKMSYYEDKIKAMILSPVIHTVCTEELKYIELQ